MVPAEILKKVRRIQITTRALVNDVLAGQYHSAFKGRGMEFEEVREYQPGDDVRSIDWNVTARTGRPFIKSFREERELTVLLVVDVSGSLEFGTHSEFKSELAAQIGATLALSAIRNNDKVGALLFSDRVERFIPTRKGSRHVLRLIRELLYHEPQGRGTDVALALRAAEGVLNRRGVVFVLSDFASPGFSAPLRVLRRRHDVIPIMVEDRLERELPAVGLIEVIDPETGMQRVIDTRSAALRRGVARAAAERRERLRSEFGRLGIRSIELRTGESFVHPLRRYFADRQVRR
ncbi:MAG: DUF58 domain-containing protein [Planctomycetia bacterium]|nr:MAG: DUF58 domain-containing protein [Planctomycetia bacterium]